MEAGEEEGEVGKAGVVDLGGGFVSGPKRG